MANLHFSTNQAPKPALEKEPWTVLVIDDDEDVHRITNLTLKRFEVDGHPLDIISAYSAAEAKQIMAQRSNIAVAIIDVVMETDDAGLELVRHIREVMGIQNTRLVLRTGQAGQAPEHEVVTRYDINDYKEKTELTSQKLKTMCYSLIRSYRDIMTIENSRAGMRQVLNSASQVLASSTVNNFAKAVLEQVVVLLHRNANGIYASTIPNPAEERQPQIVAATTIENGHIVIDKSAVLPDKIQQRFDQAIQAQKSLSFDDGYVAYLQTPSGHINLLSIDCDENVNHHEIELLEMYCSNVSLTYEMLLKGEDMVESQRELVLLMGEAVESRSKETGAHVKRVALISESLATAIGLSEEEVNLIKYAAPLHDIGKVSIPDHILHKPGKLDSEEWNTMQSHAAMGGSILNSSKQKLFKVGADVAHFHHERWDGEGYPTGLQGEEIPISARIVSVADVFDALGSNRCYKKAWAPEDIRQFFVEQRGKMFDPQLVDLLLKDFSSYLKVRELHPDEPEDHDH